MPSLVFNTRAVDIIPRAERAVFVDQEFRYEKQRNATGSSRRVRQAGKHQMDDVVGQIMFAVGDEDLLAVDPVRAVVIAFGPGFQRVEIRPCLWLGQVHGAHPLTGDQLFQVGCPQLFRCVLFDGLHSAHRQGRANGEGHGAGVPHLQRSG
jgi:hypothetical protein